MNKVKFKKEEVLSFLEELILDNLATEEELELYQDFKWSGKLNKNNYTYKLVVRKLKKEYEGR